MSDYYIKLRASLDRKDVESAMKVINSEQSKTTTEIKKQLTIEREQARLRTENMKTLQGINKAETLELKTQSQKLRNEQQIEAVKKKTLTSLEKETKIEAGKAITQEKALTKAKLLTVQMEKMEVSSKTIFERYNKGGTEAIGKSQKLQNEMSQISAELQKQIGLEGKLDKVKIDTLNSRYKQANAELGTMRTTNVANVPTGLMATAGKVLQFGAVTAGITAMTVGISKAVEEVFTLNKAQTELMKVTDLSGASMKAFTKEAFAMGREVSRTGAEAINASTEFAKGGYKQEALELGKVALMYTNIADETVSAGESASFIISQMKVFGIEAKDAMSIIDSVNAISNEYAVSSADLANNIGKVSSTMAVSNTTMQESLGLTTAITEINRDASKSVRSLSTIAMRVAGMGDESDDSDLTNLVPKMEKQFKALGLSMNDAEGQLKPFYTQMKDLAEVFPTLDKNTQLYIGNLVAGGQMFSLCA